MSDLVERARKFAEQPLMARLTVDGDYDKRTMLKSRIAGIRAGTMDNAPEVQSALIALTTFESELAAAKAREERLRVGLRAIAGHPYAGTAFANPTLHQVLGSHKMLADIIFQMKDRASNALAETGGEDA